MDAPGRPPRTFHAARLGGVGLAILLVVAGFVGLSVPALVEAETQFGLKLLFAARGPGAPPAEVVVVAIDERSAHALGLPESPRLWPRGRHAELVRRLAAADARVIAFDLTFDTPSADVAQDAALAAAMSEAKRVVLASSVRQETVRLGPASGASGASAASRTAGTAVIEKKAPLTPMLEAAASGTASFLLPKHARVDFYWTFRDPAGGEPTLPLLALDVYARASADPRATAAVRAARAAPGLSYLYYYGPPRTIATVSYADALAPSAAADARFRGKAVFVGFAPETPGAQDRLRDDYRTVYSRDDGLDLSGVEIAATAFANLLEGRVPRVPAWPWPLVIVTAFGLALAVACRLLRPLPAAFAVVALALVYMAVAAERFADAALWLPIVVPVGLQAPLALFAGVWLRYRETRREREIVKQAFARFVPAPLVDELVAEPEALESRRRVVYGVCLSTDVERYTTLAEQMQPGALGALMNDYYAELFVAVEKRRGIVVDLVGDATMAVWVGTPSPVQARRGACHAALEMAAAVERFNDAHGAGGALPTRFGVHAGDLLFGVVGASGHHEYRAVGDIANTASRIQGLNKVLKTRILASEASVAGVDDVVVRRVGSFRLVGKSQAVAVVHPLGVRGAVPADVLQMVQRFEAALDAYAARRWGEALQVLEGLEETYPQDGPIAYYRERCAGLVAAPPGAEWSPEIRVDTK